MISAAIARLLSPLPPLRQKGGVTRTVYELADFPDLEKKATAVCESATLAKSDRLKRACTEKAFPRVTKAGMFYNTGYGAEFNALIRQP
jgi:hypothetical protein